MPARAMSMEPPETAGIRESNSISLISRVMPSFSATAVAISTSIPA